MNYMKKYTLIHCRIDTMVALQILAEAAKTNIAAMKILHSLARGVRPKVRGGSSPSTSRSDASGTQFFLLYTLMVVIICNRR